MSDEEVEASLDALGFLPVIGSAFDGLNAAFSLSRGDKQGAYINLVAMIPGWGDAFKAAKMQSKVFAAAADGGKHANFLGNYAQVDVKQLDKGINSLGKRISEHEAKIADPSKGDKSWASKSKKEQEGLLKKWRKDIQRQKEQKEILEQLKKVKEASAKKP